MIRCVENEGIVQLAHRFELLQHATDLDVDVFTAREFATQFITNGSLIAFFPHAADSYFVAQIRMAMMEGMGREIVDRQRGLLRMGRW